MKSLIIILQVYVIAVNLCWCHDHNCHTQLCVCNSTLELMSCVANGIHLTYIPSVPMFASRLLFNGNYLPSITSKTCVNLTNSRVYFLELMDISISSVSRDAFTGLTRVLRLDLSNNPVKVLNFDLLFIKHLTLQNNTLQDNWNNAKIKAPRLTFLDISENLINFFYPSSFTNLKKVTYLEINRNPIRTLKNNAFVLLKHLKTLKISNIGSILGKIEKHAFNCSSLTYFDFSQNKKAFKEGRYDPENIFKFVSNLVRLKLDGIDFPKEPKILRKIFGHLQKLQLLSLQNVDWAVLPTGVFGLFPRLSRLYLTANRLNSWNGSDVFGNMTPLKKLFLDANNINMINETTFPKQMLLSLQRLDISRNPYSCTCDLLWFRNFMKSSNISFKPYPKNYQCISPPEWKFRFLKDFNPTEKGCEKPIDSRIIVATVTSSLIGFSFVVTAGTIYKCRWHIRYGIYLLRSKRRRKGYNQIRMEDNFTYDGFVIYCDEDREWVHGKLLPRLETEEGLRLCIHYRDFDVGRLIVDNIVMNMDASRKLICVLSNNFTKSKWGQFELLLAQDRFLNEGSDALVLIMLYEIDTAHINSSLRALITTNTYAAWTDEVVGQNLFWEQIITAMKRPLHAVTIN